MKKILFIVLLVLIFLPSIYGGEITNPELIQFTKQKCMENNVPFLYVVAMGIQESGFKNIRSSRNHNGSYDIGIMQINSNYIDYYERTFWYKDVDFDPWNEKHNIEMGILYLKHLFRYTKSWHKAIAAYNVGLRGLDKYPYRSDIYLVRVSRVITNISIITDEYIYYGDTR